MIQGLFKYPLFKLSGFKPYWYKPYFFPKPKIAKTTLNAKKEAIMIAMLAIQEKIDPICPNAGITSGTKRMNTPTKPITIATVNET